MLRDIKSLFCLLFLFYQTGFAMSLRGDAGQHPIRRYTEHGRKLLQTARTFTGEQGMIVVLTAHK